MACFGGQLRIKIADFRSHFLTGLANVKKAVKNSIFKGELMTFFAIFGQTIFRDRATRPATATAGHQYGSRSITFEHFLNNKIADQYYSSCQNKISKY